MVSKRLSVKPSTAMVRSRLISCPPLIVTPRRSSCQTKKERPWSCWVITLAITVAVITAMVRA